MLLNTDEDSDWILYTTTAESLVIDVDADRGCSFIFLCFMRTTMMHIEISRLSIKDGIFFQKY